MHAPKAKSGFAAQLQHFAQRQQAGERGEFAVQLQLAGEAAKHHVLLAA